jgi:hypothetical protein
MYLEYTTSIDPAWAWSEYHPGKERPWTLKKAGHLFRRAAFGASWPELQTALQEGPRPTIDRLLQIDPGKSATFYRQVDALAEPLAGTADEERLRAWWLYVLMNSPQPLLEKMTLFWHNHFATSNAKVQDLGAMLRQNRLLRKHALGKFSTMLQDISKDPAMLIWLDGIANKKGKPNENYARELMELFSLGVGHYSEADIRQAARAFTGWTVKQDEFYLDTDQHDGQEKTVLGKTGKFGGEEVVKLCLDQPVCADFVIRKLFAYFISETLQPDPRLLEPLARQLRTRDYEILPVVGILLRSNLFFSETAYRARIKPPVEFAVGIMHALEGRADALQLAQMLDPMGQRLFAPPSVKGWDGASTWLNSTTLLLRHNLAAALTSTLDQRFYNRCDPVPTLQKHLGKQGATPSLEQVIEFFLTLFVQEDVIPLTRQKMLDRAAGLHKQNYPPYWSSGMITDHQIRALCHLTLTLPEFQLS